jgi:hypothetical protein
VYVYVVVIGETSFSLVDKLNYLVSYLCKCYIGCYLVLVLVGTELLMSIVMVD